MMPHLSYTWYTCLSRGLLAYLLGLYFIGFSWHLHNHERSDTAYCTVAAFDHSDSILLADDACFVCDWLVHHPYTGADSLLTEIAFIPSDASHHAISQWAFFSRPCLNGDSRAPPAIG
ncbi:MAG: hypothetical protein RIG62_11645 [Cyclobacteriaceae bacterium]